jgi:nucleoside-diphosphate-sugar epimerase
MMKFLVIGSSGFVGSNCQKYFDNKSILELHRGEEFPNHGEEVIIHLAGKADNLKNISAPNEYYNVNSELTKKII